MAIDYLTYLAGASVPTPFGGMLYGDTYSEFCTARNLGLSGELKLLEMLPCEGVFFDVGAHVGQWTVPLALKYPRAKVHAFEGSSSTFRRLTKNIKRNGLGNVSAVHAAICEQSGRASFQVPTNASVFGRIYSDHNLGGYYDQSNIDEVPALSLAEYCGQQSIDVIDFLKLDIEGGEIAALRGATSFLEKKSIRLMWIEVDENNQVSSGHSVAELASLVEQFGYSFRRLSDPMTEVDIRSGHDGNMVVCPVS